MGKRVVFIAPEFVTQLLTDVRAVRIQTPLPEDAKLVAFTYVAYPYNRFELVFESADWPDGIEGGAIEALNITFMYKE